MASSSRVTRKNQPFSIIYKSHERRCSCTGMSEPTLTNVRLDMMNLLSRRTNARAVLLILHNLFLCDVRTCYRVHMFYLYMGETEFLVTSIRHFTHHRFCPSMSSSSRERLLSSIGGATWGSVRMIFRSRKERESDELFAEALAAANNVRHRSRFNSRKDNMDAFL